MVMTGKTNRRGKDYLFAFEMLLRLCSVSITWDSIMGSSMLFWGLVCRAKFYNFGTQFY